LDKKHAYKIHSERHYSRTDTDSLNKAVDKASKDRDFVTNTVDQLKGLKFPAYKKDMIEFMRQTSSAEKNMSLVRTLTDGKLYHSVYQVKRALEQENPEAKQANEITDETRKNLEVTRVDSSHRRKDYTEVPATATKNYVCELCGKSFQAKDDLTHHQEFEFKES
jgi:rubrerythrin